MKSLPYPRLALGMASAAFLPCAQAAPVSSAGGLVDLGLFAAGSYTLTGSGAVDICGGDTALIRPDGLPQTPVTCAPLVAEFNPNGSYTADGQFGRAGFNAKIGALIGTFNANAYLGIDPLPAQADEWFLIGDLLTLTLATEGHIYAAVNDTFYGDNRGAFDVRVEAFNPVPEPASLALTAVALGGLGAAGRRRMAVLMPAARLPGQG